MRPALEEAPPRGGEEPHAELGLWPLEGAPATRRARFWATAAAFGALWGAVEITLGSFLHVMRIPLTGPLMAGLGAALLVAQRQTLPARGLSLATGIIAALCKSVSPGGIILGPMIGITVEALLVEVALLAAPRSLVGAAAAGAASTGWALGQGVLTSYVRYGGTILDLYVSLVERAARLMGLSPAQGWRVLLTAAATLAALGGLLALAGRTLGRRVHACRSREA